MSNALFREQVLDSKRDLWLGRVSVSQPLPVATLSAVALLFAGSLIAFLILGTHTRVTNVAGQLVPAKGIATIRAQSSGIVTEVLTSEGQQVSAGEELAVVSTSLATRNSGDTASASLGAIAQRARGIEAAHAARIDTFNLQASSLAARLANARTALAQLQAETQTRKQSAAVARNALARSQSLLAGQFVSAAQVQQQESELLAQEGAVQISHRQMTEQRRIILELEYALHEIPLQRTAADGQLQNEIAALRLDRLQIESRSASLILAPVGGVVAAVLAKPGQSIRDGQPLMSVLPADDRLEAELLVPSRAIGFVDPGDRVVVRYHAYPFQKFGRHAGTVARVSRRALNADELGTASNAIGEPVYRVIVTLDRQSIAAYGRNEALRPGMRVDASVVGEKRRLIEWLLEPLYSIGGRMTS